MASPISQAIKQISDEKNIPYESVLEAVESALAAAYRKDFGTKNQNIKVEFDPEQYDGATAGIRIFDVKAVVEDMELPADYFERFEEARAAKRVALTAAKTVEAAPVPAAEVKPVVQSAGTSADAALGEEFMFNPKTMIMLADARDVKPDAEIGEEIRVELEIPSAFGRMAAQTAKQVIMQKIREAERGVVYEDFKSREGELMNVTIQRREGRIVLIDLGRATGVLLPEDQIESERYFPGTRLKAILREVTMSSKGPEIRLSRSSAGLVAALFAQEIPEVLNGVVDIKNIAREAGSRTKVAVSTNDEAVDPIGSCIGQRGTRIQTIIRELNGEKIDVISWSDNMAEYVAAALSPAKIIDVALQAEEHLAKVKVAPDQLSLAIGKGGQNVRLAAKLTGWKITVLAESGEVVADSDVGEIKAVETVPEVVSEVAPDIAPEQVAPAAAPSVEPEKSPEEPKKKTKRAKKAKPAAEPEAAVEEPSEKA